MKLFQFCFPTAFADTILFFIAQNQKAAFCPVSIQRLCITGRQSFEAVCYRKGGGDDDDDDNVILAFRPSSPAATTMFPFAGSQTFEAGCYREGGGDDDDDDDEEEDEEEEDDDDDEDDEEEDDSDGGGSSGGDNDNIVEANNNQTLTADGLRILKNDELREMLKERGMIQQGRKEEMIQRLLNPVATDFKRKQLVEPWKTSRAKALLLELLNDTASYVHKKTPEEVWESSEWFSRYPKHRFVANMKALQTSMETQGKVIKEDIRLIETELAALNISENTKRGYPHLHKHTAKKLLAEDIKAGRNSGRKPQDFQTDRSEYQEFPLAVFRSHIYQEIRKQREMPLKIAKRNKLGEKKHQQEVEAEAVC